MTAPDHIVDGQAVEVGTELDTVTPSAHPAGLFGTSDPGQVIAKASEIAGSLKAVLAAQGMLVNIKGKQYVSLDGWQLLGSMLGVVPVVVWTREIEGGWEARSEARLMATGQVVGAAEAMCAVAEGGNWGPRSSSNARRAMAQSRSMSRALRGPLGFVVTLAGYQATAAEEMPADHPAPVPPPPLVGDLERAEILGLLKALHAAGVPGLMNVLIEHGVTYTSSFTGAVETLPATAAVPVLARLRSMPVPTADDESEAVAEAESLYDLDAARAES